MAFLRSENTNSCIVVFHAFRISVLFHLFFIQVMQVAGIEGENVILLIEDHQMVEQVFLELINSLLCAGDVPGLYTSEELEPILSPLREQAMQEEFRGPLYAYFAHRVMKYLHVVLIMDCTSSSFTAHCEANPALYKSSSFQWMDSWSKDSMLKGEIFSFLNTLLFN